MAAMMTSFADLLPIRVLYNRFLKADSNMVMFLDLLVFEEVKSDSPSLLLFLPYVCNKLRSCY